MRNNPQKRKNELTRDDLALLLKSASIEVPESSEYRPATARHGRQRTPAPPAESNWRKRFLGPNGEPLPPDYTRVDVGSGQIIERVGADERQVSD